jgi:hypothetical protein
MGCARRCPTRHGGYLFQELGSATALLNRRITRNDVRQYRPQPARGTGTATGFPFGAYHFEVGADLPHVGLIPIIVGPLWFGAGYFSWTVASVLLDGADRQLDRPFNLVALPVVAAFVLTQWDLVMDAPNAFDRRPSCRPTYRTNIAAIRTVER